MARPSRPSRPSLLLGLHVGLASFFVFYVLLSLWTGEDRVTYLGVPVAASALVTLGLPWSALALVGGQTLLVATAGTALNLALHLWLLRSSLP